MKNISSTLPSNYYTYAGGVTPSYKKAAIQHRTDAEDKSLDLQGSLLRFRQSLINIKNAFGFTFEKIVSSSADSLKFSDRHYNSRGINTDFLFIKVDIKGSGKEVWKKFDPVTKQPYGRNYISGENGLFQPVSLSLPERLYTIRTHGLSGRGAPRASLRFRLGEPPAEREEVNRHQHEDVITQPETQAPAPQEKDARQPGHPGFQIHRERVVATVPGSVREQVETNQPQQLIAPLSEADMKHLNELSPPARLFIQKVLQQLPLRHQAMNDLHRQEAEMQNIILQKFQQFQQFQQAGYTQEVLDYFANQEHALGFIEPNYSQLEQAGYSLVDMMYLARQKREVQHFVLAHLKETQRMPLLPWDMLALANRGQDVSESLHSLMLEFAVGGFRPDDIFEFADSPQRGQECVRYQLINLSAIGFSPKDIIKLAWVMGRERPLPENIILDNLDSFNKAEFTPQNIIDLCAVIPPAGGRTDPQNFVLQHLALILEMPFTPEMMIKLANEPENVSRYVLMHMQELKKCGLSQEGMLHIAEFNCSKPSNNF